MIRLAPAFAVSVFVLLIDFGHVPPGWAQDKSSETRNFDYWQPEWMVRELWGANKVPKGMEVRRRRHQTYMNDGVPKEYKGAKSAVSAQPQTIAQGRKLYGQHCAFCHGRKGLGGGSPGRAVTPSPALLAYMIKRPISVDEYLLWAISDGGKKFKSKMPAYRNKIEREDIWRIIAYMRAGFPELTDKVGK